MGGIASVGMPLLVVSLLGDGAYGSLRLAWACDFDSVDDHGFTVTRPIDMIVLRAFMDRVPSGMAAKRQAQERQEQGRLQAGL